VKYHSAIDKYVLELEVNELRVVEQFILWFETNQWRKTEQWVYVLIFLV
jgi:hypothetical protein